MLQKVSFSQPSPSQVLWGWSKSSSWAHGGAGQPRQGREGVNGGHGSIGCTLQDGEKASGKYMGVSGAWEKSLPIPKLGCQHRAGTMAQPQSMAPIPSRPEWEQGKETAVAPGDGVDHEEVGYPQPGHAQFVFPHGARLGGDAWAPLPHSTLLPLSCGVCFADSCEGRCEEGFDSGRKCQCDTLCVYYQSCCSDYSTVCKAKGTVPMAPSWRNRVALGAPHCGVCAGSALHPPMSMG